MHRAAITPAPAAALPKSKILDPKMQKYCEEVDEITRKYHEAMSNASMARAMRAIEDERAKVAEEARQRREREKAKTDVRPLTFERMAEIENLKLEAAIRALREAREANENAGVTPVGKVCRRFYVLSSTSMLTVVQRQAICIGGSDSWLAGAYCRVDA